MQSATLKKIEQSITPDLLLNDMLHKQVSNQKYPWSTADEFFTSDKYAGLKLFPNQRLLLKLWNLELDDLTDYEKKTIERWQKNFRSKEYTIGIPEDIYERVAKLKAEGYDHFSNIISILGRRASKSFLSGRQLSLADAQMLWLGLPDVTTQQKFAKDDFMQEELTSENTLSKKDATAYSLVMATSGQQAQETTFTDHYNAVVSNKWLQSYLLRATPFEIRFQTVKDKLHTMELLQSGVPLEREFSSIVCRPVSTVSTSNRGRACFSYCVAPETLITATSYRQVPIKDIKVGDKVVAFNEFNNNHRTVAVVHAKYNNVIKPAVRISFSDGNSIVCSTEHRFVTVDRTWLQADQFKVGQQIRNMHGYSYIYNIQDLGKQTLCDMTTSTHTYIANGLYSHNCFDEVFFGSTATSVRGVDNIIKAMRPSLNQFGKQKLLMFPSSPWTRTGMVYRMYMQGRMLIDEYLERQGLPVTSKNKSKAIDEVDKQGEDMIADPTTFVAQLESWRLYEDWKDQSFVPTYYQGWSPKHITATTPDGVIVEFDANTNAKSEQYIYIPD